jgi:hypothetical protein
VFRRAPGPGQAHDPGELYLGAIDAILTLAVSMVNKGVFSREELAAVFAETGRQQHEQDASESRRLAVQHLASFFKLAVIGDDARPRLRVIPGGRDGG